MKNINFLFLILIPMFIFGSCVKDNNTEENIQPGTEPIVFGLATESETKGIPVTAGTLATGDKFGVYGYKRTGSVSGAANIYIENLEATVGADNKVSYGGPKYWPASKSDRLTFHAYYPYNLSDISLKQVNTTSNNNDPYLKLTYTVPTAFNNHKDVMVATNTPANYKDDVSLHFYHALTRITFQAKKSTDFGAEVVTVTKISIKNVKSSGVLTVNNASTLNNASWSNLDTKTTYTAESFTGDLPTSYVDNTYLTTATNNNSFMVIPLGTTFETDAEIEIEATCGTYTKKLSELTGNAWDIGQWVNYQFELKPSAIVFSPVTVQPWGDANNIELGFD